VGQPAAEAQGVLLCPRVLLQGVNSFLGAWGRFIVMVARLLTGHIIWLTKRHYSLIGCVLRLEQQMAISLASITSKIDSHHAYLPFLKACK